MLILRCLLVLLGGTLLSGCNQVKDSLGLSHYQADEFQSCPYPPLSLPPNYDLRPPVDGQQQNTVKDTNSTAKDLIGHSVQKTSDNSAEKVVLEKKVDKSKADASIRKKVDEEKLDNPEAKGPLEQKLDQIKKDFKKNVKRTS